MITLRDSNRNEGQGIQAIAQVSLVDGLIVTLVPGIILALVLGMIAVAAPVWKILLVVGGLLAIPLVWNLVRRRRYVCGYHDCQTVVDDATCPGCGATITARVHEKERERVREEQLERAVAEIDYPDCDNCQPEKACSDHQARLRFDDWTA